MEYLETARFTAMVLTGIYIWIAASHYLAYNVNVIAANVCFYGGISFGILCVITSPRVKRLNQT